MKIGLVSDNANTFPSLPLMKISAYHKSKGDHVEIAQPSLFANYDLCYVSRVFNLNLPTVKQIDTSYIKADKYIFGGSGYAIEIINGKEVYKKEKDKDLPTEIETIYPDYSLFPQFKNTAYGFLTRGCPNNCGFCIVNKKDGLCVKKVADLSQFWNGQKNIVVMDANLLACKERENLLKQLVDSKANIDYTQGLDARFIDKDIADLICKTKIKMVHFAFDLMKNEEAILKGLKVFADKFGKDDRSKKVYILTNYNTTFEEDYYRVRKVIELGYQPDIRIYQKPTAPQITKDLARWANNSFIYRSCEFKDYEPRKGQIISKIYKI